MAFTNEYAPAFEDENAEYFRAARKRFAGFVVIDKWTVDRDKNMALPLTGRGSDIDSQKEEYWSFLDGNSENGFMTKLLESREISKTHIYLKRSLCFNLGPHLTAPDGAVIEKIKQALSVRKDYGVLSKYETCELVLLAEMGAVL